MLCINSTFNAKKVSQTKNEIYEPLHPSSYSLVQFLTKSLLLPDVVDGILLHYVFLLLNFLTSEVCSPNVISACVCFFSKSR